MPNFKGGSCHECQGFLFSKPVPADVFEDFLKSGVFGGFRSGYQAIALVG